MKLLHIEGISRKYLRLAATYRRFAGHGFDFSKRSLLECFLHESKGYTYSKDNGYVYGKWMKDITLATWIEDISKGDLCKSEIFYISKTFRPHALHDCMLSRNGWWAIPAIEFYPAPNSGLFCYRK